MEKSYGLLIKNGLDKQTVQSMSEREYKLACAKLLDTDDVLSVCKAIVTINYWRAQHKNKALKTNNL